VLGVRVLEQTFFCSKRIAPVPAEKMYIMIDGEIIDLQVFLFFQFFFDHQIFGSFLLLHVIHSFSSTKKS
jgi:hypothetical protein